MHQTLFTNANLVRDGWAERQPSFNVLVGTDLWGPDAQKSQLREFEMRQGIDTPSGILRSATATNAELLMEKGTLGTIAEGAYADLLVVEAIRWPISGSR